jgi:hypothetical protein
MSTFGADGTIDPARGVIATMLGKKRSGKSIMGLLMFMQYPGDRVVIDVAGDDGPIGPDVVEIRGTLADGTIPDRWPSYLRKADRDGRPLPMILRYVPDAGSKTFLDDMDAVVALALAHGQCAILVHEIGVLAPANKTRPHTTRLLMHNRHNGATTAFFCGPRSQNIDPLILQQSDLVFTFEMQGARDRQRIAENIGWDVQEFNRACLALGVHEYLRFDANEPKPEGGRPDNRLLHFPALDPDIVADVQAWAEGKRPAEVMEAW